MRERLTKNTRWPEFECAGKCGATSKQRFNNLSWTCSSCYQAKRGAGEIE